MRAARFYAPGDVRVEDVPRPEPGDGDVLVRVEVALTDGTDLKAFRRGHPILLGDPPAPFGHEFCGFTEDGRRIVAANSDGDRADLQLLNGAYAEWLVVPERIARVNLLPVPDGLPPEVAAMVEPLACCLYGVERAGVRPEDTVAVVGTGPIGLMLCACIADAGARPVAVGRRSELAREFGAEPGDGRGADIVIEASGNPAAVAEGLEMLRDAGRYVVVGQYTDAGDVTINPHRHINRKHATILGCWGYEFSHLHRAIEMMARHNARFRWRELISREYRLEEASRALEDMERLAVLKAIIRP